ncbi:hypothetical protein HA402_001585 [Bradysia odoriphaga]|nr:hypothetical protein HA402_001585 [Bradysia odoriphaga]
MKSIHGLILILSLIVWADVNGQTISPYQVAIRLYDNFLPSGSDNINLCNGAIIHESYVLTTADCMHSRIRSANLSRPYNPSMIYVAAGSFQANPTNTRYVETITVHESYNPETLANDIALVKVSEPFPLRLRNNLVIQWIALDAKNARYENCFVSFQNQTSTRYPYTSPQAIYVMDNWFCNNGALEKNSTERMGDICSHYLFNDSGMCKLQPTQFQISSDRGTPLVCNNHVTGLLSQIQPPRNDSNPAASCESTLKTWAFYTKVSDFTEWIHLTIARQQPTVAPGQQPVTSPPYYTPPHSTTQQQQPHGGKPTNNASSLAKSVSTVLAISWIVFNFLIL